MSFHEGGYEEPKTGKVMANTQAKTMRFFANYLKKKQALECMS